MGCATVCVCVGGSVTELNEGRLLLARLGAFKAEHRGSTRTPSSSINPESFRVGRRSRPAPKASRLVRGRIRVMHESESNLHGADSRARVRVRVGATLPRERFRREQSENLNRGALESRLGQRTHHNRGADGASVRAKLPAARVPTSVAVACWPGCKGNNVNRDNSTLSVGRDTR
jgi:hypothetical protein